MCLWVDHILHLVCSQNLWCILEKGIWTQNEFYGCKSHRWHKNHLKCHKFLWILHSLYFPYKVFYMCLWVCHILHLVCNQNLWCILEKGIWIQNEYYWCKSHHWHKNLLVCHKSVCLLCNQFCLYIVLCICLCLDHIFHLACNQHHWCNLILQWI